MKLLSDHGLAAAILLATGCAKPSPTEKQAPADLAVEVAGCAALQLRDVHERAHEVICQLDGSHTLRIALPPAPADATNPSVTLERDGEMQSLPYARLASSLLAVEVPALSAEAALRIDATVSGAPAQARVLVGPAAPVPWLDEARAAWGKGELEQAASISRAHAADHDTTSRAVAKGTLARLLLARGRADESFPLFREAIDLHRAAGRPADAADDSFALAFALHQRSQRYTEARAVLDAATADIALYAEGRARDPYYRGILAGETGDRRRALRLLGEAERRARRLGMERLERNARSAGALELQELGRPRESLARLAAVEADLDAAARGDRRDGGAGSTDRPTACERVEIANDIGWGELLANEAAVDRGETPSADPRATLERALAIEGCDDAYVRGFALANLARLALTRGDLDAADRHLAAAKAGVQEPRGTERLAWIELEGRILLGRGRGRAPEALRVLDDGLALARASVLQVPAWSFLVARAEALEALRRAPDAIASLKAAEEALDAATLLVPLGEGRGAFAGGRSRSSRALVGLLVAAHREREAASVGRRARARVLGSVERALRLEQLGPAERAHWEDAVRAFRAARAAIDADAAGDWKLPSDQLARVADARGEHERQLRAALEDAMAIVGRPDDARNGGEDESVRGTPNVVELDIYPDLQGFLGIVVGATSASAHRLPNPEGRTAEELAQALLEPARRALETAETVIVRPYGAYRHVDVHALPWRGEPLLARVPVLYSIGLGRRAPAPPARDVALVVGDPTGDLPASFDEAHGAARALRAAYADVRLLVRDQATSEAVVAALRGAASFHYAGHGVFAGAEGWESALPLAAGGRLTVADVLALAPTPKAVVLAGCEAATSAGDGEGLGLAQAFLVAGSEAVLAPTAKVADAASADLARGLYTTDATPDGGAPAAASLRPLAARARSAILALRQRDPSATWARFRVFVP